MKKLIFFFTFVPLIILYLVTMPPTVFWQDSGIFLAGVKTLGIIYPPGFSFYLITAHLWSIILSFVFNGVGFTGLVIAFSGFFGALSGFVVGLTIYEILIWLSEAELMAKKQSRVPSRTILALISAMGGLASGVSYSLWSQAVNAEVYSMASFFIGLLFYLLFKLVIIFSSKEESKQSKVRLPILLILIIAGFSFSVHPLVILLYPVFVFFGYLFKGRLKIYISVKSVLVAIVATVVSFAIPIIYIPIRSYANPEFLWSKIANVSDFVNYLLAKGYFTGETSLSFFNRQIIVSYPKLLISELNIVGLLFLILGVFTLLRQNKHKTIVKIIAFTAVLFYVVLSIYSQGSEYNYWLIPIYNLFYIVAGIGVWSLFILGMPKGLPYANIFVRLKTTLLKPIPKAGLVAVAVGIIIISISFIKNIPYNNRHNYYLASEFGKNILRSMPQNSILFTVGDQDSAITTYLQIVENYRSDIALILSSNFLEEWKMKHLGSLHPGVYFPEFTTDLTENEKSYIAFTTDFLKNNLKDRNIFMIQKSVIPLPDGFYVIPAGAIWQVSDKEGVIDLKYWNYEFSEVDRYKKPEKKESSRKIKNSYGIVTGMERVKYSDESKNFELQAYKNLGDVCFEYFEKRKPLIVKNERGVIETWLTAQLLMCARDNYEKMIILDPAFYRVDIWEKRVKILRELGEEERAREVEREAAVRENVLKN